MKKKKVEEDKEKKELNTYIAKSFRNPVFEKKAKAHNVCYAFVDKQANSEYCLDFLFLLHITVWTWLSLLCPHLG